MRLEVGRKEVDTVIAEVRRGTKEVNPVIVEVRGGKEEVDNVMRGQSGAERRWTLLRGVRGG